MNFSLKQKLWTFFVLIILLILFKSYAFFVPGRNDNDSLKINNLLISAKKQSTEFNFNESIFLSKKALRASENQSYRIGIIKSNYQIAFDLCNLGNYDESIKYINILEKSYGDYIQDDFQLNIDLADLKGRNFLAQGFKKRAKEEFRKELGLAYLYKDSEKKYQAAIHAYTNLSASCETDSAYFYMKKILSFRDKVKDKKVFYITYISISDYYYKERKVNIDSALYYNSKGIQLAEENNSTYMYIAILQKAELLFLQKKYHESLQYTLKGIRLSKERNRSEEVLLSYKLLADNYRELGDYKLQSKFLDKYSKMNDSIFNARQTGIQASADVIFNEQDQNKKSQRTSSLWYIISSIFIICAIGLGLFFYFKKNKKPIEISDSVVENKSETELPNVSYEEIIALAKGNSSDFLFRFKEIYPSFFEKLYEIEPELITSELTFCAYLKLQFSTKEIASYTFVTPKAVQNRKNRIRKKLNIPSNMDIYTWIGRL